jgi:hypothetical protein
LAGIVVALAAALADARLVNGLLFITSTVDPLSTSFTVGTLIFIAALAALIPAGPSYLGEPY